MGSGNDGGKHVPRSLIFRDSSKNLTGEQDELGSFRQLVVGVVDQVDSETLQVTRQRDGRLQPRNWHLSEGPAIDPRVPDLLDRRISVSLIADHEHGFSGFEFLKDTDSPYANDWDSAQKSTRIVDYDDPRGKTALFASLCKVVDDHLQQYTAAIPLNRQSGGHELIGSGYLWDENLNQNAFMDTVFILNPADIEGSGIDGTPYGLLGIRTDAHFEWTDSDPPDGSGGDKHGAIHFDTTDLTGFREAVVGAPFKAGLGWDPTVKNKNTGLGLEAGHWRPFYRVPQIVNENPPWDGPVSTPNDGGGPPTAGGLIVIPPTTSTTPTPPDPGNFASLCILKSGGTQKLRLSQPDGTFVTVGGLGTGTLSGRPGTPATAGDTHVATDKFNAPQGGTANADPTNFFAVGINDALQWAHVAIVDFDQTITGYWTFNQGSSAPPFIVTSTPSASTNVANLSAGAIAGRKVDVNNTLDQFPLVWNASVSKWQGNIPLGVAAGGSGSTAGGYTNKGVFYYDSSAGGSFQTTAAPSGDKILQSIAGLATWVTPLSLAAASGTNIAGTALTVSAGQQTGNALGGSLLFKVGFKSASSGATVRSLATALEIDTYTNVVLSRNGAIGSAATGGFTYIPGSNGVPTGVPVMNYTGATAIYYDQLGLGLYAYDFIGGSWVAVGGGGTHALLDGSIDNDTLAGTVARGDVIIGNSTPKWARLAIGGANQVLHSDGTDATWQALVAGDIPNLDAAKITTGTLAVARGGTNLGSYAVGDILYASGATTLSKLAAVATGSVLASAGVTTAPAWNTISAVLDTIGSTRGSVLYRGASGWAILAPGTSGNVLTSNGAGADPTYQAASGGTSFADNVFDIHDDGDATKKLVLQCSGISTGTTRTWTVQDLSGTVPISPDAASGTNVAGTDFTCFGGKSTGNQRGGKFVFQSSEPGTSGASVNSLITVLSCDASGALRWGSGLTGSGAASIFGPTDQGFNVLAGDTTTTNAAGLALLVRAGSGNGTGAGGAITAKGGSGGLTSGDGGASTFGGGDANTSGSGGIASLSSGAAVGTNQAGAGCFVNAGPGTGIGNGGDIVLRVAPRSVTGGTTPNALVTAVTIVGSQTNAGTKLYLGPASTSASLIQQILAPDRTGVDASPGGLHFSAGASTGSAAGGSFLFDSSLPGTPGSGSNSLGTFLTINPTNDLVKVASSLGSSINHFTGPTDQDLLVTAGTVNGTNVAGRSFVHLAGAGTGNAAGGSHFLKSSLVGSNGSLVNTLITLITIAPTNPIIQIATGLGSTFVHLAGPTDQDFKLNSSNALKFLTGGTSRVKIDANGNTITNDTGVALATNATNGFLYVPSSAGTPTGVPASLPTGAIPLDFDSTNNKLYGYSSSFWQDVGHLPKGYVQGLLPKWVSNTTVSVAAGSCRDDTDKYDIAPAAATIDITSATAANGLDQKTSAATISPTNASPNATASASIVADLGTRIPTFTSFSTVTTAMTGVGTKFLSEVAVGDLVGNSTKGYSRVTAIASDTSLTLVAALPGGDATGGSVGLVVIENPTIRAETNAENKTLKTLSAAGTAIVASSNWTGATTNQTLKVGVRTASTWLNVWAIFGTTGSAFYASTQRTTLIGAPSGYTTAKRRLYAIPLDGSSNLFRFYCSAIGPSFLMRYDGYIGTVRVLSAGTSLTFVAVDCSAFVPPTSSLVSFLVNIGSGTTGSAMELRETTSTDATGSVYVQGIANVTFSSYVTITALGQAVQYQLGFGGGSTGYLDVAGWVETP